MPMFRNVIVVTIHLQVAIAVIPYNRATVEKFTGIFAQKVHDGGIAQIIVNEKMVDTRRRVALQVLQ